MLQDEQAQRAAAAAAGRVFGQVYFIDSASDAYQLMASSTVALSLSGAVVAGESVSATANALSVADFALLGSVTVVTGVCAAVGAAVTRPRMIASLADLIATLQVLWVLFPTARRLDTDHCEVLAPRSTVGTCVGT